MTGVNAPLPSAPLNVTYSVEIRDPLPDGSRPSCNAVAGAPPWRRILSDYHIPLGPGAALHARLRAGAPAEQRGAYLRKSDIRRIIDRYRAECITPERDPARSRAKRAAETAVDALQSLMLCYELRGYDARLLMTPEEPPQ
jgi:hypothetical protein